MCIDQSRLFDGVEIKLVEFGCRCELRDEVIDEVSERGVGGWLLFEKGANLRVDDLHYNAL
jgi:hypothetical protein